MTPPPFWNFSKISSNLETPPFPNGDGDGDGDDNNDIKLEVQVQHRTVTLPAIRTIASPQYQQVRS